MPNCKAIWISILLSCFYVSMIKSSCPYECSCRNEPTKCEFGVSLVTDGCKCCKMCAKQQGEWCDEKEVCDIHRGLVCDYTDSNHEDRGICKAQQGRSCYYKGRTYLNGEMIQPSCKHQCWCIDSAVGCLSLCPHETLVPRADVCPGARLEDVPGQCCKEWVCAGLEHSPRIDMNKFWDEIVDDHIDDDYTTIQANDLTSYNPRATASTLYKNSPSRRIPAQMHNSPHEIHMNFAEMGDGGPGGDELLDYQVAYAQHKRKMENGIVFNDIGDDFGLDDQYDYDNSWEYSNEFEGDDDARRRKSPKIREGCNVQTTKWGPCSKTCGLGISSRVTNRNSKCLIERETRLCQLRPCEQKTPSFSFVKKGRKHCMKHRRARKRIHYSYAGCSSIRSYKPRYCGTCQDGRCCVPQATRMVKVKFRCVEGKTFSKKMMMIRNCKCNSMCPKTNSNSFPTFEPSVNREVVTPHNLTGDMYPSS